MSRIDHVGPRTRAAIDDEMMRSIGKKSNYERLFGTPEKAARTYFYQGGDDLLRCGKCPAWRGCKEGAMPKDSCIWETEDAMLEWLMGDAE